MSHRFLELIRTYKERPPAEEEKTLLKYVAEKDPFVFAHHPDGPEFRDHVWKIGGLFLCKGCLVTFAGIVFGAFLFLFSGWLRLMTDLQVGGVLLLLLTPTLATTLLGFPRWCRHIARFLLGIVVISAFLMLFVTDSWLVRAVIVAAYFGFKIPLERRRNRENEIVSRS